MKLQEQTIETIEINPDDTATHSIIWLHGLGADGNDFAPIVPELKLSSTRFIFPHAPIMPVTINNGYKMRAWYDIYDAALAAKVDENGIAKSKMVLESLIAREEERGVASEKIILAGFSQGAVIALVTGLGYPKRLGGIMALSGFLPIADKILTDASQANKSTPVFIGHGTDDPILPFELGEATAQLLKNMHYPVTWKSYPMGHSVCAEEIGDIREWLVKNK